MGTASVTVVLLVHEPTEHDAATPALVRAQTYGGPVTILAIDSSADPGAPPSAALRAAADVWEAIPPAAFGHGRTRNRAADACTTALVVYLSQDAHPVGDGWLAALVAPIADERAVAAYGRQEIVGGDAERAATFNYLYPDQPEVKTQADIARLGLRAFHFSDVTSAFRTDVLRAVRFPEDVPVFEDVGVAKRLLEAGHAVAYVPDAVVAHGDPMRPSSLFRRYRQIGAIYQRLGVFRALRDAGGPPVWRAGLQTANAVAPAESGLWRRAGVAALKAGAVTLGRVEARIRKDLPRA